MNRYLSAVLLVVAAALVLASGPAVSSHKLAEFDPTAPFTLANAPRAVIIEYFTASKNADAERASRLIDYDEWAKRMGMDEKRAKLWMAQHRAELPRDYRLEKAAGSTKNFEILEETVWRDGAEFEVTQDRAAGLYRWRVTLMLKGGRWAIVGFDMLSVARQ